MTSTKIMRMTPRLTMMAVMAAIVAMSTMTTGVSHGADRAQFDWTVLERLAIQERGRIKPFQTFAEESVQFVTGSRRFENRPAVETVMSWLLEFETSWEKKEFVRISYGPLKAKLGLSRDAKYFSPQAIGESEALKVMVREIGLKSQRREKLSDLENKAASVQNQLGLLDAVVAGQAISILPSSQGLDLPWLGVDAINDASRLPYTEPQKDKTNELLKSVFGAFLQGDAPVWNSGIVVLESWLRDDLSRSFYPAISEMSREVHFNQLRPFRWAWVIYVLAFVCLLAASLGSSKSLGIVGGVAVGAGMLLHTYGFALRCWISGRPPVTNMYESVIWVSLGCLFFACVIWAVYRNSVVPMAATVFSVLSLVLADNLPTVLDPGIHPLEPVLRSNFWLTTHVLCITLSYAAFALSLCIGNVVLGNFMFRPQKTEAIQSLTLYMYRSMQIGVILVAAGTILGGVWADYSWGRFWGWDPKEVWALIVLLMYVAVLHGRFTGWLKGFGFVTATIFCFLSVLMAWYGVNFVLGVGLHSYGFGSGGVAYVMFYVLLQLLFVLAAWLRYRRDSGFKSTGIFPQGSR